MLCRNRWGETGFMPTVFDDHPPSLGVRFIYFTTRRPPAAKRLVHKAAQSNFYRGTLKLKDWWHHGLWMNLVSMSVTMSVKVPINLHLNTSKSPSPIFKMLYTSTEVLSAKCTYSIWHYCFYWCTVSLLWYADREMAFICSLLLQMCPLVTNAISDLNPQLKTLNGKTSMYSENNTHQTCTVCQKFI